MIRSILRRLWSCGGAVREAARARWRGARRRALEWRLRGIGVRRLNLASGNQKVAGYLGVDIMRGSELRLDLDTQDLPFPAASMEAVVCMSAINYFSRRRAMQLVREMYRVLRPGGVCRIGVQDMKLLAERYVRGDAEFFFQKLADGRERFEGPTIGDKFAAWFYGYAIGARRCRYFYDFESMAYLVREAGFSLVERKRYRESRIPEVDQLDNRADQMFFLEAVK